VYGHRRDLNVAHIIRAVR